MDFNPIPWHSYCLITSERGPLSGPPCFCPDLKAEDFHQLAPEDAGPCFTRAWCQLCYPLPFPRVLGREESKGVGRSTSFLKGILCSNFRERYIDVAAVKMMMERRQRKQLASQSPAGCSRVKGQCLSWALALSRTGPQSRAWLCHSEERAQTGVGELQVLTIPLSH